MSPTHLIARNTMLQVAGHVVGTAASVATLSLLARYLGVRGYGTLSLVVVVSSFASLCAGGGLDTVAVRSAARSGEGNPAFFRHVLGLRLTLAAVVAVAGNGAAWLAPLSVPLRLCVVVASASLLLTAVQATFVAALQARQTFAVPAAADAGGRLLALAGYVAVIFAIAPQASTGTRLVLSLAVAPAASLGVLLATARAVRRVGVPLLPGFDLATWRRLLAAAVPLAAAGVLGAVNYRLDLVVLSGMSGARAAGVYAVACRFVDAALPLAILFVAAAFPALAATRGREWAGQSQRAFDFLLLVSLPICFGGVAIAPALVRLVAGAGYADAVLPLRLLLLSLPFTFVGLFLVSLAVAGDRQSSIAFLTCGGVAMNLVLNVTLVPYWSYVASAAATLATEVAGTAALIVLTRRWFGIRLSLRGATRAAAAAGVTAAGALLAQPLGAAAAVVVGVVLYAVAALALRAVRVPDLRLIVGRT